MNHTYITLRSKIILTPLGNNRRSPQVYDGYLSFLLLNEKSLNQCKIIYPFLAIANSQQTR